jgi:hypothetical protein
MSFQNGTIACACSLLSRRSDGLSFEGSTVLLSQGSRQLNGCVLFSLQKRRMTQLEIYSQSSPGFCDGWGSSCGTTGRSGPVELGSMSSCSFLQDPLRYFFRVLTIT